MSTSCILRAEENKTDAPNGLIKRPYTGKRTGTTQRFKPDIEVFTDIGIPLEYYCDVMKRQAVVNAGLRFVLKDEVSPNKFETTEYRYEKGIMDYVAELAGESPLTPPQFYKTEKSGRDRPDKPEYRVKAEAAFCFFQRFAAPRVLPQLQLAGTRRLSG